MSDVAESKPELVSFDSAVYDLDTIKRAVYRFSDRFSADISIDGPRIVCALSFRPPVATQAIAVCVGELRKEVLDQDLRKRIAAETAPIRNSILALAFSNPKLRNDE